MVFLAVIIPVFILSFYINKTGQQRVNGEYLKGIGSKVDFCLNAIEKETDRMLTFMKYYTVNEYILDLSGRYETLDYYERSYAVRSIQKDFNLFMNTVNYSNKIFVYIKDINKAIANGDFAYFEPDDGFWETMMVYYGNSQHYDSVVSTGSGLVVIPISASYDKNRESLPDVFFYSEMSNDKLLALLDDYLNIDGTGTVMYSGDFSWELHDSGGMASMLLEKFEENGFNVWKGQAESIKIGNKEYLLIGKYSDMLDISLVAYLDKAYLTGNTRLFQAWFWVLLSFAVAIIAIFSFWLFRLVYRPFHKLVGSFAMINEDGAADIVLKYDGNDEFKYLYSQINALVTKHNKLIKNYYEERYRSQMNELIFLQSQIKPHFFYNSLYLLQNILRLDDVDNGLKIVKYLSNYLAFLAKSSADTITLDDELTHTRNYVEIQKFRYMERINVEFGEIPDEYRKVRVPRLILQPLIENCFKHGLSEKVSEGIINVDFTTDRQVITISIRDNGKGFEEQQVGYLRDVFRGRREPDEVTGLINVNRRLVLKYGPESGLRISNNESGGSKVDVIILKEEQEDVQADDRG